MTVEELIGELMASCQSLDDTVFVGSAGVVTLVGTRTNSRNEPESTDVWINDYPQSEGVQGHE